MKFSESYVGQPVFIRNNLSKIGYIKKLSFIEYNDGDDDGSDINIINNICVIVDRGGFTAEYDINELTPAKGNM